LSLFEQISFCMFIVYYRDNMLTYPRTDLDPEIWHLDPKIWHLDLTFPSWEFTFKDLNPSLISHIMIVSATAPLVNPANQEE
jgi:hypothetical protein